MATDVLPFLTSLSSLSTGGWLGSLLCSLLVESDMYLGSLRVLSSCLFLFLFLDLDLDLLTFLLELEPDLSSLSFLYER